MAAVLIGKGLLEIAPVLTIITASVKSICNLIDSISTKPGTKTKYTDSDISELVENLDIRSKLDTYRLLLSEFPGTRSQSVKNSLISVKNAIVEIESKLKDIKKKLDYNKKLWILSGVRSYSITKDMKLLEKLVNKLDKRIESLKTVTEIAKLWNEQIFIQDEVNKQQDKSWKASLDINESICDIGSFEIIEGNS